MSWDEAIERTFAECDIEGCHNVACRIVTNPDTDEILLLICEAHAGIEPS